MTEVETGAGSGAQPFGDWVRVQLARANVPMSQLAYLSGIQETVLIQALSGRSRPNQDTVQRIATIMAELRVVPEASVVWEAAGYPPSPYINPPETIVRAISGNRPGRE